jgi:beta-glucanase (GH16 family)
MEAYVADAVSITADGMLQLRATATPANGRAYSSGQCSTRGKFSLRYGLVEARIKIPLGKGIWPAFWLLPDDDAAACWPTHGEIDVMESVGDPHAIFGSVHYGAACGATTAHSTRFPNAGNTDFSQDFHVFSAEWDATAVRFYVDGVFYAALTVRSFDLSCYCQFVLSNHVLKSHTCAHTHTPKHTARMCEDVHVVPHVPI